MNRYDPHRSEHQSNRLINRQRELAHSESVIESARNGVSQVLVFRGVGGIGKTALLQASVDRAPDFGVVQLRGTSSDGRTHTEWPQPFAELFVRYGALGDEPSAPSNELVEATARALERISHFSRPPLLVVIDDCQFLPRWFPSALARVAAEGTLEFSIGVLIAWRDVPHSHSYELEVDDIPSHRLTALDADDARKFLSQHQMEVPPQRVLKQLVRVTAGVPLALLDVYDRLSQPQLDGVLPLPVPIPVGHSVVDAFEAGIVNLSDEGRVAAAVAALGAPLDVLESALGHLGIADDALEEVRAAGVIQIRHHRVDFEHPLVRAAAFYRLHQDVRDRIHTATAVAYAKHGLIERSAFHAGQGQGAPDDGVAGQYATSAKLALGRGDLDQAAVYEKLAADFSMGDELTASHLTNAATLWCATGRWKLACNALASTEHLRVSDHVRAEVVYQQARLRFASESPSDAVATNPSPSDEMVRAAELCESVAPQRAVTMLLDASALKLIEHRPAGVLQIAEHALSLARGVSSNLEALAQAQLMTAQGLVGESSKHGLSIGQLVGTLIGQVSFPASPYVARLIGEQLLAQGELAIGSRWAIWLESCAKSSGDQSMRATSANLLALIDFALGNLEQAIVRAEEFLDRGDQHSMVHSLAILTVLHSTSGDFEQTFQTGSRLLGIHAEIGSAARLTAQLALASVEIQRRRDSAANAWLWSALEEADTWTEPPVWDCFGPFWAMTIASVIVLGSTEHEEKKKLVDRARDLIPAGPVREAWSDWIRAVCIDDLRMNPSGIDLARHSLGHHKVFEAGLELLWGARLEQGESTGEARERLRSAAHLFRLMKASGWARRAEVESRPGRSSDLDHQNLEINRTTSSNQVDLLRPPSPTSFESHSFEDEHRAPSWWRIDMLGSLAVWQHGKLVTIPHSLASQGLTIIALRRRVPLEELAECLWPEADPGVGVRRMRNVLWRIRATCGNIVERDGNTICLANETVVDVDEFRRLANLAVRRDTPRGESIEFAREAVKLYRGELLPSERYADWAAGPRESLARQHVQLLRLLLDDALETERLQDAFGLFDRLIEADPYDEEHRLELAELYARTGNRTRALRVLEQAERVLEELGLPPTESVQRIRSDLNSVIPITSATRRVTSSTSARESNTRDSN